jgi:drug/metabolite transporter (DMT)-like permease
VPAELWALSAAFCYALAHSTIKFAAHTTGMVVGLLITLVTGLVALSTIALITVDDWAVPVGSAVLFAIAGLAGPGAGRILAIRSVRDVGATVAVPVQSSSNPAISTLAGVLLFGETVGPGRVLALALIICGIWLTARGGSANRAELLVAQPGARTFAGSLGVLLPLLAGAAYSTSDILRKSGLEGHGDPVVAALIGTAAALLIWTAIFLLVPQFRGPVRIIPPMGWFCLSGLLSVAAQISLLSALRTGDLSAVSPIVASQPVIVIVLGGLMLRSVERLRLDTIAGAMIVFLGVAYLSGT